jgi:hypothetical protein
MLDIQRWVPSTASKHQQYQEPSFAQQLMHSALEILEGLLLLLRLLARDGQLNSFRCSQVDSASLDSKSFCVSAN